MDDLLVYGGMVAGQQQDIAIHDGRIRQIAPGLRTEAGERLDVTGKLVLPGFVESHIHPDKAFVADRAPGLQAGGPTPQVLVAELKKAFTSRRYRAARAAGAQICRAPWLYGHAGPRRDRCLCGPAGRRGHAAGAGGMRRGA